MPKKNFNYLFTTGNETNLFSTTQAIAMNIAVVKILHDVSEECIACRNCSRLKKKPALPSSKLHQSRRMSIGEAKPAVREEIDGLKPFNVLVFYRQEIIQLLAFLLDSGSNIGLMK